MVMTLRKRVAPVRKTPPPSPLSSPEKRKARPRRLTRPARAKRARTSDSESGSEYEEEEEEEVTEYEKFREERMRENRERMEKLGIFALSSKMFAASKAAQNRRTKKAVVVKKKRSAPIVPRAYEPRRSSRHKLKDSCVENERTLKDMGISIPDSWTDEVYTEEHEKLLGDCEKPWTLNVDGFGEDGEPLYDPVNGTSCHQCRQKTLRKHTFCSKCRSGQGQLCGDCLYTRYGENVTEAMKNPEWLCLACRGICNCSRCRRGKGWPPVTILYPKVLEAGFKSVAHYLILSRRAGSKPMEPQDETPVIDLTEGEAPAPAPTEEGDEGSDTSSEWCESESEADDSDGDGDDDDDESATMMKHSEQAMEEQADATDVTGEPAYNSEFQQELMVFGGYGYGDGDGNVNDSMLKNGSEEVVEEQAYATEVACKPIEKSEFLQEMMGVDDSTSIKKHSEQADATEVTGEPAGSSEFQQEMMVFGGGPSCQLFAGI